MPFSISDFHPMNELRATAIAQWTYGESLALYNVDADEREEYINGLIDPSNHYFALVDEHNEPIAFFCFGPDARVRGGNYASDTEALDIGYGLRPSLTGQGLGKLLLETGLMLGIELFSPPRFRATVASSNERSLRICRGANFVEQSRFTRDTDHREFVTLVHRRNATCHS